MKDSYDSLELWSALQGVDKKYCKDFQRGGGFRGTAIDPMYRIRRATEQLGPVGIYWGWNIIEEKVEGGIHWIRIRLWYKYCGEEGSFESVGCTTMFGKNKYGDFADEEAPKKSLTDAITKGLSFLGCCASVYMGEQVDNKYTSSKKGSPAKSSKTKSPPPKRDAQKTSGSPVATPAKKRSEEPPEWLDDIPF